MSKIKLNIQDSVADTLLITLYTKSIESKKKDPLIVDETACELVEKIDYDFSKYKDSPASTTGVAIRSTHFDNVVKKFIEQHPLPIVVLVGCGLDSRVQRIGSIAQKALFYELDLEEVINIRKALIPPGKNERYIAASMLTTDWMDDLKSQHPCGDFLFVIEGVLMYFNEPDNQFVFRELAKRFPGAQIHFDMLNKWMSTKSSMHETVKKTNATFKFGIDDEKEIEKWQPSLRHVRTYLFHEFRGWTRMGLLLSILMSVVPTFKTSSRILAYKVAKD
ncbi:O-methyltransferase domain protein [Chloroherpeton thalassium ATCC 35110]|uniref:O-methyltransferase domain protein n=1 Tax=Chloroherpeton thalassium (strain ATCC 35110 / GB-78) TaxID=517418 RepID=B3QXT4_CHLT3|nr:class I SAM-dependent methyltransferase [Chloroherpeton thalassium]ACF13462.1 O-methyltransferase domain protein [Chloroherpeton thalassium ATCC 35110]